MRLLWTMLLMLVCACQAASVAEEDAEEVGAAESAIGSVEVLFANQQALRSVTCNADRIFWVEHYSGDVQSSLLDGSDLRTEAHTLGPFVQGFAVDHRVTVLTPGSEGKVRSLTRGDVIPVMVMDGVMVGRDLTAVDGELYWTEQTRIFSDQRGVVREGGQPWSIAGDASSIFWFDLETHQVKRAGRDGSGVTAIAGLTSPAVYSLRLDSQYVWWADGQTIYRRPKIGFAGPTAVVSDSDGPLFVQPLQSGVAWASPFKIRVSTSAAPVASVVAPSGLTTCGGYLFWSTWTGQIARVSL